MRYLSRTLAIVLIVLFAGLWVNAQFLSQSNSPSSAHSPNVESTSRDINVSLVTRQFLGGPREIDISGDVTYSQVVLSAASFSKYEERFRHLFSELRVPTSTVAKIRGSSSSDGENIVKSQDVRVSWKLTESGLLFLIIDRDDGAE